MVHHRRRHRAAGLLIDLPLVPKGLFSGTSVLRGAEFGLGDAVDAIQCVLFDTDVFADNFGSDAGLA